MIMLNLLFLFKVNFFFIKYSFNSSFSNLNYLDKNAYIPLPYYSKLITKQDNHHINCNHKNKPQNEINSYIVNSYQAFPFIKTNERKSTEFNRQPKTSVTKWFQVFLWSSPVSFPPIYHNLMLITPKQNNKFRAIKLLLQCFQW